MPGSVTIALVVLGGVLVLIAVLGGKFKIWGAEIEDSTGNPGRIAAGILGVVFILIAIVMGLIQNLPSPNASANQSQQTASISAAPTADLGGLSTPSSQTVLQPAAPPTNFSCPAVPGVTSLTSSQWTGPLQWNNGSYYIGYDQNNFYVWSIDQGNYTPYPLPDQSLQNQWVSIGSTPLKICGDPNGNMYAAVSQQ